MARKSIIMTTRLLPSEKAEAARRAAEAGLSLNAYVVRVISGQMLPPLFLTDGDGDVQLIPEREALGEVVGSAMDRLSVEAVGAEVVESDHPDMRDATPVVDGIVSKRYVSLRPPFEALAPAERYGRLLSVCEAMFAPSPVMDDIPWKDGKLPRFTVRTPLPSGFATMEDGTAHPASAEVVGATDDDDAQWMLDQAEREADRSFPDGGDLRYGDVAVAIDPDDMAGAIVAGVEARYGGGAGGGKTAGMKMAEAVHAVADAYGYSPSIPRVESPALRAMLSVWPGCQHPKTPENTRKVGKGRVACKECRKAVDRRHAEAKSNGAG